MAPTARKMIPPFLLIKLDHFSMHYVNFLLGDVIRGDNDSTAQHSDGCDGINFSNEHYQYFN